MVTSLRAWMAAERPDNTESASFYVAGAKGWDDPLLHVLQKQQQGEIDTEFLYPTPEWVEEDE